MRNNSHSPLLRFFAITVPVAIVITVAAGQRPARAAAAATTEDDITTTTTTTDATITVPELENGATTVAPLTIATTLAPSIRITTAAPPRLAPPRQSSSRRQIRLKDVSLAAGLDYSFGPRKKFGGPTVADFDDDGYPDLLFGHHDKHFIELYFNQRDGTFKKLRGFSVWSDVHALNAFRYGPRDGRSVYFAMSQGGAYGRIPAHNRVFRVGPDRSVTEVTEQSGFPAHTGRGRSTVFLPLRAPVARRGASASRPAVTDVLSLNALRTDKKFPHHAAFRNAKSAPRFAQARSTGIGAVKSAYATAIDYDNDGRMDLVTYEALRVHKITGDFAFTDVTASVLPRGLRPVGVVAVAELDFDNDGLWDLYVATTRTGGLSWRPPRKDGRVFRDYLLRNVGGRYVDVSDAAGIPQDGLSRGVTVADLDNDGHVDIVVSKFSGRSVVLRNRGNGRFAVDRTIVPPLLRANSPATGLTAVDYDLDGRVDIVMGEGDHSKVPQGGFYRLFRNVSPAAGTHYLLVRVGMSPRTSAARYGATPLHAVVSVRVGRRTMMRRVGSPGATISLSLIETMHFGLGSAPVADEVRVTWLDGASRTLRNVVGDQVINMGNFGDKSVVSA